MQTTIKFSTTFLYIKKEKIALRHTLFFLNNLSIIVIVVVIIVIITRRATIR